jgi:NADP-reducing hydrogenase subunit HndD
MVTALRMMGFDHVFDTQFAADLTIMEEGHELLGRLRDALAEGKPAVLPMMTSCSPGWIKFLEHYFPDFIPNLSTCKSPQQMFGAVVKSYWSRKTGVDPADIVCVSAMPCTAKKYEAGRPEMESSGRADVDYVLTTRELATMIKQAGLDLGALPDSSFDDPLGQSTGAATIFAATGGVMEAAIRTAWEVVTGSPVPFKDLAVTPVRGMDGVKEAALRIEGARPEWAFLEGVELRVLVAHGTANAKRAMTAVRNGSLSAHFIEIMTCPGGCLGGGGQPLPVTPEKRAARARAIYEEDSSLAIRKSHENPSVLRLYADFLGAPSSHLAHELLHTTYTPRGCY